MSEVPMQVLAFDDMIRCSVEDFLALSTELGEPFIEFGFMVKDAFDKARQLIEYGLYNTLPADQNAFFQNQPLSEVIRAIQNYREANRKNTDIFSHLSMVSESILALNWFMIKPAPCQFIKEMRAAGEYFGNRVLTSNKGNANHSNYVQKWTQILKDLESYVKQYFLTGFTWGAAQGGMVQPPPPPPSAPLPPPPPPPIANLTAGDSAGNDMDRQALIKELNQGTAITSRLKPVNKSEQRQPVQQAVVSKPFSSPHAAKPQAKVHPPKFVLEGRKWVVEHQKDNPTMTIDNEMSHSLAMFSCQSSCLEVLNKINNIVIDTCKKVNILIRGDVISCVEVIRCEGVKIQCEGIVPLINVANSDNIQVFVNEKSQHTELVASKSSSLNMCLIKPDGDYVEFPVPEQIMSVIENGKLKSSIVENI